MRMKASCRRHRVPHAGPIHEERAARAVHEQAAPAARSVAVDHVDFPQSEARAVGHFDGARHSLGVDGRPLGTDAFEHQVDASDHKRRAA